MSLPLKDRRISVNDDVWGVFEDWAHAHGMSAQEVAREVLGSWADSKDHFFKLRDRRRRRNDDAITTHVQETAARRWTLADERKA